ncbi:hypothetical protein HK405_004349 [Cladochytrium tenue]|nr:hypothetical protein HK405_004349 [Cladochytrium tenue]
MAFKYAIAGQLTRPLDDSFAHSVPPAQGTAACPTARFYCANDGFRGASIPSSRVNDGICEAAEWRRAEDARNSLIQKGLKIRNDYVTRAAKARRERESEIQKLEAKIGNLTVRIDDLKFAKAEAEAYESRVTAAKARRKSQADAGEQARRGEVCRETGRRLLAVVKAQNERIDELSGTLEYLASLEASEEGAAFQALLRDKPILKETLDRYYAFRDANPSPKEELQEDDKSAFDDEADIGGGGAGGDDDGEDLVFDDPCDDPTTGLGRCVLSGISAAGWHVVGLATGPFTWSGWTKVWRQTAGVFRFLRPASRSEELAQLRADAGLARSRLSEAETELRAAEERLRQLRGRQGADAGPDGVWDALVGSCVSADVLEYTYELCFLDKVTQKRKDGGGSTSLGTFTRWGARGTAGESSAAPGLYLRAMFENGVGCWNGPARSVEVRLECGAENKILGVSEPSKCESPASCEPAAAAVEADSGDAAASPAAGHQEL